jgi:hypothetical protein
MLLGLHFGTDKGEVQYSLSQNNAPVSTSLTTWIKSTPVIGSVPGENLGMDFCSFSGDANPKRPRGSEEQHFVSEHVGNTRTARQLASQMIKCFWSFHVSADVI